MRSVCICCKLCGSDNSPCDCVEDSSIELAGIAESVPQFEFKSRQIAEERERRWREIDSEFGDDTENWFHKWNEGLIN